MKAFIDRIFKKRKHDAEQIEENKKILAEQIETAIKNKIAQDEATEVAVEAIIEEVKEVIKKEEVKKEEVVVYPKPNHFPDCNCFKCMRWIKQNAK
jgi:membrane-associated HD superfamily phosphohydrolase